MGDNIKGILLRYNIIAVLLPLFLVISIFYLWHQTNEENNELNRESRLLLAKTTIVNYLAPIRSDFENFASSRELADYLHNTIHSQLYSENMLYSKLSDLMAQYNSLDGVMILDAQKKPLIKFGKNGPIEIINSRNIVVKNNQIIFTKPIKYDSNYISSHSKNVSNKSANLYGYIIIFIDLQSLFKILPYLEDVSDISGLNVENVNISITELESSYSKIFLAVLLFWIILIFTIFFNLRLIHVNVLKPIETLTTNVKRKTKNYIKTDNRNEIVILEETFSQYCRLLEQQSQLAAVGKTTQMIAHDIRQPFTMLKCFINLIEKTESGKVKDLVKRYSPALLRSHNNINSMLEDIMEIGREKNLVLNDEEPLKVIVDSLEEIFIPSNNYNAKFKYHLSHSKNMRVDSYKVQRVFSNIFRNALEANSGKVDFEISVKDATFQQQNMVNIEIKNFGAPIPSEYLNNPHLKM